VGASPPYPHKLFEKSLTKTLNEKREAFFRKGSRDEIPCGVEGQRPSWGCGGEAPVIFFIQIGTIYNFIRFINIEGFDKVTKM